MARVCLSPGLVTLGAIDEFPKLLKPVGDNVTLPGMAIYRGPALVTKTPDANGNYRAINRLHPEFVGYGRSSKEAEENLQRNVHARKKASLAEEGEAFTMIAAQVA